MLIIPSFKKSLIVEQFQGNYLKPVFQKDRPVPYSLVSQVEKESDKLVEACLLYTSPSPRDLSTSRMPSSA